MIGKSVTVSMTPPGGTKTTLVGIDAWDYNWQETYWFKEPLKLKAGTRLDIEALYDNSSKNPNNPRNPQTVVATARPRGVGPIWFQRWDRNNDGDITWREFLGPRDAFEQLDVDHDELIDPVEAEAATALASPTSPDADSAADGANRNSTLNVPPE